SVHLEDWPDVAGWPSDDALADTMDLTRNVCSAALSLRKARQLRVRLPLASLTVAHESAPGLSEFADIIKDEVNVKDLRLNDVPATLGELQLTVNPRVLGPRLGKQVQEVIKAVKAGQWTQAGDVVTAAGIELQPGEYELKLTAADPDSTMSLPGTANGLIALDTAVTPELIAEGSARDVIRVVQQARKDAGFDVSDRISLTVGADGPVADAVRAHAAFVAGETLATELTVVPAAEVTAASQPVGDGGEARVSLAKSV
ncbi:MAG TPA: DUF5915 domain-containing protein, partial [Trebonia sp.]|nr:DUF5915 domain-containing protein [Trebonia sp.]